MRSQESCSREPTRPKDVERRSEARRGLMTIPMRHRLTMMRYSFDPDGKIRSLSRSSARRSAAVVRDEVAVAEGAVEAEDVRQVRTQC